MALALVGRFFRTLDKAQESARRITRWTKSEQRILDIGTGYVVVSGKQFSHLSINPYEADSTEHRQQRRQSDRPKAR